MRCSIDGQSVAQGATNPANSCEICDPRRSATAWSANDGMACDDGLFCNGSDACAGGTCSDHAGDACASNLACIESEARCLAGVFVSETGNDSNAGTMDAPKATLGAGIAAAGAAGSAVFVSRGSYAESVTTPVSLYGGFSPDDWSRDTSGNATTIGGSVILAASAKSKSGDPVALDGFTVVGGAGTVVAAVTIEAPLAVLRDNAVVGGTGSDVSYGVLQQSASFASVVLENNRIDGGDGPGKSIGAAFENADVLLTANTIGGGDGDSGSLGVSLSEGTATVVSNVVVGGSGGSAVGIEGLDESLIAVGNTIIGGSTGQSTGLTLDACAAILVDNILGFAGAKNGKALAAGLSIRASTATLGANDFFAGSDGCLIDPGDAGCVVAIEDVNACAWTGCESVTATNLSADPLFVDGAGGDYHLAGDSPCIDAGTVPPDCCTLPGYADRDGRFRPQGAGWDIGAYEYLP